MHERIKWAGNNQDIVAQLRERCLAFPESLEVEQFGHPWFKAGKRPFCIAGQDGKNLTISFSTSKMDQDALCQMPGFRPTPYMHQHGWTTLDVEGEPDWGMIEQLLDTSYRNVALKRMLSQLDA